MTTESLQLDLAEYLAEAYFPHDPVQPLQIAEQTGITSSFGHYEDAFDGLLEVKNQRFHIYLNQDRLIAVDQPRARFTAAHELAHYFIDDHRNALLAGVRPHPSFTEFVTDLAAERQADEFAATLLMPPKRFLSSAKGKEISLHSIEALATLFGTSISSTAIRFALSSVAPVCIILWGQDKRKWCWSSEHVYSLTLNKAHRLSENVPSGSATQTLLTSTQSDSPADRGSVLSSWFPFIRPGAAKDKLCREEAMRLGSYGVLTLLEIVE